MRTNGGIRGANKVVRILKGIQECNGSFSQIWRVTGLQQEELEGELEVLRHLGFVEVVPKADGRGGTRGGARGRRAGSVIGMPGAAYRVTEKGKRAFSSFELTY